VHFLDPSTGWVVTDSPNRLLFTTDTGKSWNEATPPSAVAGGSKSSRR
jgi:photosystem II stability/assembly factor-like uncharacterized protein